MNWNWKPTVAWDSKQQKRFVHGEIYRVLESVGRMFLTFFLFINTTMGLVNLPEEALSELATEFVFEIGITHISFLKLAFVIVAIWAVMPAVRAIYRLWVYRHNPPGDW